MNLAIATEISPEMITFSFSGATFQTGRVIGDLGNQESGPVMMFIGGIHGNEPSGVVALQQVFTELRANRVQLSGRLIGVTGNLLALSRNKRFISRDLNRLWHRNFANQRNLQQLESDESIWEHREQDEVYELIEPLLTGGRNCFFIDLHTTSGKSAPFIAINDQLNNRDFALKFPVPTVLGIEEHLDGPLLSYLNEFGPVALAFEAGQHDDPESVRTHKSFIYRALVSAGILTEEQLDSLTTVDDEHQLRLENQGRLYRGCFEVIYKRAITPEDNFKMNPGFQNFTPIKKGESLACDRLGEVLAPTQGRIFMPLYQASGNDGFFIVRRIPAWAMNLSKILRNVNFDTALTWLPGVSRSTVHPDSLVVNKRVARFLATEMFHLLGYRRKRDDGDVMLFSRREIN